MADKQYVWGYKKPNGFTLISSTFDDFDECYEDYGKSMEILRDTGGVDLSTLEWRGVFNTEQMALMVMGKSIYMNELEVRELEW